MFRSIRNRELLGQYIPSKSTHPISTSFSDVSYSSPELLARLTKSHELEGHRGCVNTIYWSKEGDKLLSGSDDTNLCIFKTYENFELATKIETGHKANIFSAKFLPCTSDVTLVSCAGDCEIRVFDIYPQHAAFYSVPKKTRVMTEEANGIRHVFGCHRSRVKRLALQDGNPYFFLSCSEDGTVRQFDLREPHPCSRRRSRSIFTNFNDSSSGCPPPLVDYRSKIELNTISLSQLNPNYFAIAGSDSHIFLHDRRMAGPVSSTQSSPGTGTRCVKRFINTLNSDASSQSDSDSTQRYRARHITAVKISESNGRELLGSWSGNHVYLFDIHDSVADSNLDTGKHMASSSKIKNNPSGSIEKNTSDTTDQLDDKEKFELLRRLALSRARRGEYPSALKAQNHLIRLRNRSVLRDHRLPSTGLTAQRVEDFLVRAVLTLRMAQNEFTVPDPENAHTHLKQAADDAKRAGSLDPDDWRAAWTSAVAYMLLAVCNFAFPDMTDEISDDDEDSNEGTKSIVFYVAEATLFVEMARNLLLKENSSFDSVLEREEQEEGDKEEKMNLNQNNEIRAATKKKMMVDIEALEEDLKALEIDAHVVEDTEAQDKIEVRKRKREKKGVTDEIEIENVILKRKREKIEKPNEDENVSGIEIALLDTTIEPSLASASTPKKSDVKLDCERWLKWINKVRVEYSAKVDEWGREETETIMISDEGEIERKVGLSGKTSILELEDYEDDMEEDIESVSSSSGIETEYGDRDQDEYSFSARYPSIEIESGVETVYAKSSFKGHCNVETVKDVNFYGQRDEYVISGSDDGALFIWNKLNGKIVQLLQADGRVVNCIQGHPFYPIIAASGIDNTVKIFSPSSPEPQLDPIASPSDPKAYSASSLLWDVKERTTQNENRRTHPEFRDHIITRGMLQALAARLHVGFLNNENTDMEEGEEGDEGVIGCEMQ